MKWPHLLWLILFAGITGVPLDARGPASLVRLDELSSQGLAPRVVSATALSDTILAGGHDEDDDSDRQTRGRRRSLPDQDDDDRDSDGDSDSDDRDRRRRPRWGGFPFPERERNPEARRSPRDRGGYSVEAIPAENGYSDGYDKGLEDGRDQRGFDPTRHRWYRSADRGYDGRYGSRTQYARIYSCDIICLGQGTAQQQWDVLSDAEGAQNQRLKRDSRCHQGTSRNGCINGII
jgi:hypothetical protein